MIKFEIDKVEYEILFYHEPGYVHPWGIGETACYILREGNESIEEGPFGFPHGVAFCSDSEPGGYCEQRGEKEALANALRRFPFTKKQRAMIWSEYHIYNAMRDNLPAYAGWENIKTSLANVAAVMKAMAFI